MVIPPTAYGVNWYRVDQKQDNHNDKKIFIGLRVGWCTDVIIHLLQVLFESSYCLYKLGFLCNLSVTHDNGHVQYMVVSNCTIMALNYQH